MAQQDTRTLAGGCFGKVYREKYKDQWAAIKRVPLGLISKQQLDRECKVYRNAQHHNVVKLLGDPWLVNGRWNIPLEFITGEELETTIFCSQKSTIQLTPSVRATIITGMCAGLHHLHSKDIVHQDIKPDNIMVEHETHRAIIIDLGLAKFFKDGKTSAVNLGNEAYSAPEILRLDGVRDKRSDVWAMGKVMAELCARVRLPTHAVTPSKIQETLAAHPYNVAVSKMVDSNPASRASMALVMSDIRAAEARVKQEERAGGAARAYPGLRAGIGLSGGDNKPGLQYRAGLHIPSPAEVKRSPSPVRDRFQPSPLLVREKAKPVVEVSPRIGAQFGVRESTGPKLLDRRATPHPRAALEKKVSPPVTVIQRNPPKREEEIKTLVPCNVPSDNAVTKLLQEMTPFPCPIPRTGRIQHSRYVNDGSGSGGLLEVNEVVTENGKVTKYEGFKVNMG